VRYPERRVPRYFKTTAVVNAPSAHGPFVGSPDPAFSEESAPSEWWRLYASAQLDELVTADAVDEICVTLAPKLVAHQPVGLRRRPSQLPMPIMLRLEHALTYDDYVFLKYRR